MAKKNKEWDGGASITPKLPDNLPDIPDMLMPWPEPSDKAKTAMKLAYTMHSTKHGLFASVPLVCKADKCPYASTCIAHLYGVAPYGERCPIEISNITMRFKQYCEELDIDDKKMVNVGLVKDLIDCEIMIERANQLIAENGGMINDVVVGISEDGTPIHRPEIHKALEIKERYGRRKDNILQLLNSTPKDKAKQSNVTMLDPSKYAAQILNKFMESQKDIEDAEFTEN